MYFRLHGVVRLKSCVISGLQLLALPLYTPGSLWRISDVAEIDFYVACHVYITRRFVSGLVPGFAPACPLVTAF